MKIRSFACCLSGVWIAGSLFMMMVAIQNFRSVDKLLASPAGASAQIETMGRDTARMLLRYQVSEQNRWYFETWEKIQLGVGAVLLVAALRLSGERGIPAISILLLCLVVVERFYLTPEIVRLGRSIDFVSQALDSPERKMFWTYHGMYSGVEMAKLALEFLLAGRLILSRGKQVTRSI